VAVSRLYATAPAYVLDQPAFLNIAVKGHAALSPVDLLAYLKQLEADLGRQKTARYGPRVIDVDIIFYDDLALNLPDLVIPHPAWPSAVLCCVPWPILGGRWCIPCLNNRCRIIGRLTS